MESLIFKNYDSSVKDVDATGIIVVAANAFNNKDAHGDISMKGSYSKTIKDSFNRVRWYRNHDRKELLGVPLEASETDQYLVVKGRINLNKQLGRDTYEDYKMYAAEGKSLEHSVGVRAIKKDTSGRVYEWLWKEYSTLTDWGANDNTPMLSLKSEGELIEHIEFIEKCLRVANYSDEKGKQLEQHITQIKALLSTEPSADEDTLKAEKPLSIKSITNGLKLV